MVQIKTDQPPFRMRIEHGHLVPVTQYDAERLDTFRASRELLVYPTQQPNNKLLAKFHAVLGEVIKSCPTPWSNVETAKSAIKLALGHLTPFKSLGGHWRHEPRSLTEMNDKELSEFFDEAMALLERITGVDPLTLQSEAASVDAPEDPAPITSPERETKADPPSPGQSSSEGGGPSPPPPSPIVRCCRAMLDMASNERFDPRQRQEALAKMGARWKQEVAEADHPKVKQFLTSANAILKGETDLETAIDFYAEALGCAPQDLRVP